jgi:hypothetical protein
MILIRIEYSSCKLCKDFHRIVYKFKLHLEKRSFFETALSSSLKNLLCNGRSPLETILTASKQFDLKNNPGGGNGSAVGDSVGDKADGPQSDGVIQSAVDQSDEGETNNTDGGGDEMSINGRKRLASQRRPQFRYVIQACWT